MKDQIKDKTLAHLYDLAERAHSNVSFFPEKRAAHIVSDYSAELDADLEALGDNPDNYKEKYISHLEAWLRAKSNCFSMMITGASNFPLRRHEKANNAERARYEEFVNWRERYFKAANRVPRRKPEDELEVQQRKLADLEIKQEGMKEFNKLARKHKNASPEFIIEAARQEEIPESAIKEAWHGFSGKDPLHIASFTLTNNNAKIKNTRAQITALESRIDFQNSFQGIDFEGGNVVVEDGRIKVFNDTKPSREIIDLFKKSGFRWSPNWKCWTRQLTGNAMSVVNNNILPRLRNA